MLTIRCDGDWCVIERENYGPFSDAMVEGSPAEMLAIAAAIDAREPERFKRCAVAFDGGRVKFWSPRNSVGGHGVVSLDEADELAKVIRAKLAPSVDPERAALEAVARAAEAVAFTAGTICEADDMTRLREALAKLREVRGHG